MSGTDYFTPAPLQAFTTARSSDVNANMAAIQGGFDKLPTPNRLIANSVTYAVDTGAANALQVALASPVTAYTEGLLVTIRIAAENTGAATINVDGLGAKNIIRSDGTALSPGDLREDAIVDLRYDGTVFRLIANVVTINQDGLDILLAAAQLLVAQAQAAQTAAEDAATEAIAATVDYTAADVLSKLLTVDGNGSGLDADLVRGTAPGATGLAVLGGGSAAGVKSTLGLANVNDTSDANKPVSTAQQTALDLKAPIANPIFTGSVTLPGDPVSDLHAASKGWVNTSIAGLTNAQAKPSVALATTANITLSGEQTIDGTLTAATEILVKDQTAPSENGIYTTAAGAWTRRADADSWTEIEYAEVVVTGGTANGGTRWQQTVIGGTMGSTGQLWVLRDSAPIYTASGGISKSGVDFRLANMPATTIKGNKTGGSAAPGDLTGTEVTAMLDVFGTAKGLVPAVPSPTGTKYLADDGAFDGTITPAAVAAVGTVSGSNLSGTNTGDQTITLTGNVTGSGSGSFAATIANDAVTNAKLANMATATIKGRRTAGTGDPEDIALADLKSDLGLSGTNSGDQTSVTGNAGTATALQTARTIAISGPVTGTATSFNGTANITIPVTAVDLTHANISGTLPTSKGGTGTTSVTGSGSLVKSASPTFTGTITFAAATFSGQVTGALGSVTAPTYSFSGDPNTGIYSSAADTIDFATGGQQRLKIDNSSIISTLSIYATGTTPGNPAFRFYNDSNSGIYSAGTNTLGIAAGAALRLAISPSGATFTVPVFVQDGSAAAPSISFASDADTGFYWSGSGGANFASNGVARYIFANSQLSVLAGAKLAISDNDGLRVTSSGTPASASAAGTTGTICWDANYIYVCVASNTWKRAALSTW